MARVMEPVDEKCKPGIPSQFKQLGWQGTPGMRSAHRCHGDVDRWTWPATWRLLGEAANNTMKIFYYGSILQRGILRSLIIYDLMNLMGGP
jgi:hypothetical protein